MPETPEISGLLSDLSELQRELAATEDRIRSYREELTKALQAGVRGGSGTSEGFKRVAERLEYGLSTPSRARVGGGAYLGSSKEVQDRIKVAQQQLEEELVKYTRLLLSNIDLQEPTYEANKAAQQTRQTTEEFYTEFNRAYEQLVKEAVSTIRQGITSTRTGVLKYLDDEFSPTTQPPVQGPTAPTERLQFEAEYRKLVDELSNPATQAVLQSRVQEEERFRNSMQNLTEEFGRINSEFRKEEDAAQEARKALEEESKAKRASTQSTKLLTEEELTRAKAARPEAFQVLEQRGFTPDQPGYGIRIKEEASSGISRIIGQYRELDGTLRELTVVQDRYGNILVDTQRRFRTLGDAITRNIVEVFKWTVAVSIIYGPLRKLQELVEVSIRNESSLADIAIVLGQSHKELGVIFEQAARAAQYTGESIDGVLEGYTLAFRATGRYGDGIRRTQVAQQLLVDSLILSKLSALDQASAMDTLVGALQQLGLDLDQGSQLLDKWVAVTKVANVSLDTLAESFAITSTTASNAGLSLDELNGIIAVVAENTTLSATEAGNAVRAFISGFQTDKAQKTLAEYGIALQDAQGEARGFYDVMLDIAGLREVDFINEQDINRIGEALGGGARRGAQYVAFINNLGRVQDIAAASSVATGDAYDALATKTDTVQTALTRLSNSFQTLAETLGTEGGILDILRLVLDVSESIVDALSQVTEALGPITPFLLAGGFGAGYLNKYRGGIGGPIGGVASALYNNSSILQGAFPQASPENIRLAQVTGNAPPKSFSESIVSTAPQWGSVASVALIAGVNAARGEWDSVGGNIAGAIVGGLVGGPIGTIIGSLIGEVLVDTVFKNEVEFQDLFDDIFVNAAEKAKETAVTPEEQRQQDVQNQVDQFEEAIKVPFADLSASILNLSSRVAEWAGIIDSATQLTGSDVSLAAASARYRGTGGRGALNLPEIGFDPIAEAQRLRSLQYPTGTDESGQPVATPFLTQASANRTKDVADQIDSILKEHEENLKDSFNRQEVTAKKYRDSLDQVSKGTTQIIQIYTALGSAVRKLEEPFVSLTDVVVNSTEEQRQEIINLTNVIASMYNVGNTSSEEFRQAQQQLLDYIRGIETQLRQQRIVITPVVELDEVDSQEFSLALREALQDQEEYLQAIKEQQGLTDADIEELKRSYEPWFAYLEGRYQEITGVDKSIFQRTFSRLQDEGKISTGDTFGIRTIEATQSDFVRAYNEQYQFIKQAFGDKYKFDIKEIGVIFEDGTDILHLDNLVMQLAMQELIDLNRKQLDGIYNLPADASFFVPFQGYELGFANKQTGGEFPNVAGTGAEDQTSQQIERRRGFPGTGRTLEDQTDVIAEAVSKYIPPNPLGRDRWWLTDSRGVADTQVQEEDQSSIFSRLNQVLQTLQEWFNINNVGTSGDQNLFSDRNDLKYLQRDTLQKTEVSANLNLDVSSNINLIVDGRILANIVKTYLYEDMVRFEGTAGGDINRALVV